MNKVPKSNKRKRMKYLLIIITIVIILFSFTQKESNIKALNPQDTILAFGDSLTYGYNAKPNESYPTILSHLSGMKVINAGVSGDTSSEGLLRLPQLLEDKNIKLMILFLGANDVLQRLPMENIKTNLKKIIQMAKEKQIAVLLVSVPNFGLFGLSPLALYSEIEKEEKVPLLSGIYADILGDPSLKSDQVHPNALGYRIMAEKIYVKLKKEGWL